MAHNKFVTKSDFIRIKTLCNYISPFLKSAIDELENIKITKSDRVNLLREDIFNQYKELNSEFERLYSNRGYDKEYFDSLETIERLTNQLIYLKEEKEDNNEDLIKKVEENLISEENRSVRVKANFHARQERLTYLEQQLNDLRPLAFPTEDEMIKFEFINLRSKTKWTFTEILKNERELEGMLNNLSLTFHQRGLNIPFHQIKRSVMSLFDDRKIK